MSSRTSHPTQFPEFIELGYPLDQLMDARCLFPGARRSTPKKDWRYGGITLTDPLGSGLETGTGNIVIRGRTGTGKTTLALQLAVACARMGYLSAYIPLEFPTEKVCQKADVFGWEEYLRPVEHLHESEEPPSREELGKFLMDILTQPARCPLVSVTSSATELRFGPDDSHKHEHVGLRRVLVPTLSPRSLSTPNVSDDRSFWERYQQIENLLDAAEWLRSTSSTHKDEPPYSSWYRAEHEWLRRWAGKHTRRRRVLDPDFPLGAFASRAETAAPDLRLVCLDSLNVFGDRPLPRELLFRLFDLFSRHRIVGVFVVEENVARSSDYSVLSNDDTIDYLADVVISLDLGEDKDYSVRHLEIVKSRYQPQVLGKHPFKIQKVSGKTAEDPLGRNWQRVQVYPSLHRVVGASDRAPRKESNAFEPGATKLRELLPPTLYGPGAVVTIEGPRGTFKTTLAVNFLMHGLAKGESGLLIRLHDRTMHAIPQAVSNDLIEEGNWQGELQQDGEPYNTGKLMRTRWHYEGHKDKPDLVEVAFKSGHLLPEELIDEIIARLIEQKQKKKKEKEIRRAVLDDVSSIGLSYPYLYSSRTAGDLFLTAFIHLLRLYDVDVMIAGTTGDLDCANECVDRAKSIADAVLSCSYCDVFGERHVMCTGEGLILGKERVVSKEGEPVPGVIRWTQRTVGEHNEVRTFDVDTAHLRGLVGFDTGNIHRPGISIHCFEEAGVVHHRYNGDISRLLEFAFASPPGGSERRPTDVSVVTFNSRTASSMVDSLGVLEDKPLDRTVLCTVDEFWSDERIMDSQALTELEDLNQEEFIVDLQSRNGRRLRMWPYYANVLLLAYRCDGDPARGLSDLSVWGEPENGPQRRSWKHVAEAANSIQEALGLPRAFESDESATETRACALLDALLAASQMGTQREDIEIILEGGSAGGNAGRLDLSVTTERARPEIEALTKLLPPSSGVRFDSDSLNNPTFFRRRQELTPDCAVYLCWYSQLRDLMYRHRELAGKIGVCRLPGYGFRGDWYIGVSRGSVSVGLGMNVLSILCSEREDYKRFARGVGLPTRKVFLDAGLPAWLNSPASLDDVLAIHADAWSRSRIKHYKSMRPALYSACEELGWYSQAVDTGETQNGELATQTLERLAKQLKALHALAEASSSQR
jgi:KaiC/GvpD/RAD55 family RecA-like ATPase